MRLIDAYALMRRFMDKPQEYYHASYIVGEINTAPTIEERKIGKWTKEIKHHKDQYQEFDYCEIRCSVCGGRPEKAWHLTRFCPNCGCAMELFKEETNER